VAREQRRLAAIIAADIVGYSRLMGRDESETLARPREHRKERPRLSPDQAVDLDGNLWPATARTRLLSPIEREPDR
jgi:hypothetical protein